MRTHLSRRLAAASEETPVTAPESLPSRFDAELDAAVHSRQLADLVRTAFDDSAPP
jgi:hypothetical protein